MGWRFSYEALRRWYLKAGMLLPRGRRRRCVIALDETVVKVVGAKNWLWNAVDLGDGETVASYLSRHRSGVDTCLSRYRSMESTETYSILHSPPQHEAKLKLTNPSPPLGGGRYVRSTRESQPA